MSLKCRMKMMTIFANLSKKKKNKHRILTKILKKKIRYPYIVCEMCICDINTLFKIFAGVNP